MSSAYHQAPGYWQAICMLCLWLPACSGDAGAAELDRLWRQARQQAPYVQPSAAELRTAQRLFTRQMQEPDARGLARAWTDLRMRRVGLHLGGRACQLVMEAPDARRGRGLYLFCPHAPRAIALQLPHGFKDEHTGRIGLQLASSGEFALVAWNTVPRSYRRQGQTVDADLAHLPESYFTALTRAVAASGGLRLVVQLHGFSQAKRRSAAGRTADFILSSARREAGPSALALAACLRQQGEGRVRIYPREVRELGALSNRQAAVLRETVGTAFLHVEMSAEIRKRLVRRAANRRSLLACLPR